MRIAVIAAAVLSHSLLPAEAVSQVPQQLPEDAADELEACEMQTSLLQMQTTLADQIPASHQVALKVQVSDDKELIPIGIETTATASDDKKLVPIGQASLGALRPSCKGTALDLASIELHVIGWRRPKSLRTLLIQLQGARYTGWDKEIPLHVHVDGGADGLVVETALGFKWPHGPIHLDARTENVGLRSMWLTSLTKAAESADPNTLMIVLEDDMRVSPMYFQGLMRMIKTYARNPDCREPSLMGISLSPIRMQEMRKPFAKWHAETALNRAGKPSNAFLSSTPSSWGSAYFADRWLEFAPFVELRVQQPYYDTEAEKMAKTVGNYDQLHMTPQELYIPNRCRSNVWPHSWKRFMVDFMFARGTLMLYPSLPGERALASTLQLSGSHVAAKKGSEQANEDGAGDSGIRAPLEEDMQRNPRIAPLLEAKQGVLKDLYFPPFDELIVMDLFLEPATRKSVQEAGVAFLNGVDSHEEFADLVKVWRGSK